MNFRLLTFDPRIVNYTYIVPHLGRSRNFVSRVAALIG